MHFLTRVRSAKQRIGEVVDFLDQTETYHQFAADMISILQ